MDRPLCLGPHLFLCSLESTSYLTPSCHQGLVWQRPRLRLQGGFILKINNFLSNLACDHPSSGTLGDRGISLIQQIFIKHPLCARHWATLGNRKLYVMLCTILWTAQRSFIALNCVIILFWGIISLPRV